MSNEIKDVYTAYGFIAWAKQRMDTNGNTRFVVVVRSNITGQEIASDVEYGYGSAYEDHVLDMMEDNGWLPKRYTGWDVREYKQKRHDGTVDIMEARLKNNRNYERENGYPILKLMDDAKSDSELKAHRKVSIKDSFPDWLYKEEISVYRTTYERKNKYAQWVKTDFQEMRYTWLQHRNYVGARSFFENLSGKSEVHRYFTHKVHGQVVKYVENYSPNGLVKKVTEFFFD